MHDLNINMQPVSFNNIIKFFMNTKPGCSYNIIEQER